MESLITLLQSAEPDDICIVSHNLMESIKHDLPCRCDRTHDNVRGYAIACHEGTPIVARLGMKEPSLVKRL